MNPGLSYTLESLFGPPSEKIDIRSFLDTSVEIIPSFEEAFSADVEEECCVADIVDTLNNVWSNPILAAHLIKDHDHTVSALHASVNSKASKSGRKPQHLPDPDTLKADVTNLQKQLDVVPLSSFKLDTNAILFMRTSKNSDNNLLNATKTTRGLNLKPAKDAVVTISAYTRVPWGPSYVNRSSQHALLSSQSLQDVYQAIPCVSNNLPLEAGGLENQSSCVICIEGFAYGSGIEGHDYSEMLLEHLAGRKTNCSSKVKKAATSLKDTSLSSLSLRLNEPYWLVHQGGCEHFIVVDQIRLIHSTDSHSGYPLTLQITPPLLDLCRGCAKVPAVWSIAGDVRLGESPCVLCTPCWRSMGESVEEGVIVLPLPDYIYE